MIMLTAIKFNYVATGTNLICSSLAKTVEEGLFHTKK